MVTTAWMLAAFISTLIGLAQYFSLAQALGFLTNQPQAGEAYANLRQRNQFATLTNIGLLSLLWRSGTDALRAQMPLVAGLPCRWPTHLVYVMAAILLAAGNAASSSRTGLLQLAFLCTAAWICGGWKLAGIRHSLLAALVGYAAATLLLPWFAGLDPTMHGTLARIRSDDAACSSRITLWSNVLHLIAQKPWLGWGWGELDYAHYITLYDGSRFCDILDNAHNLPLHIAVELGIPAAVLFCGGIFYWVWRCRPWSERDPDRQLAWGVLALILLHSLVEYPLWYGPFQMAVLLCLLILWRTGKTAKTPKHQPNTPLVPMIRTLVAIILGAFCVYAAWDYHRISQIYLPPQSRDTAYQTDTLGKNKNSWLFSNQVVFAELMVTPLTRENAQWTFDTAQALLHFSPEPRVIEKVIESAVMLQRDDEALRHLARYKAAFAADYRRWTADNAKPLPTLPVRPE